MKVFGITFEPGHKKLFLLLLTGQTRIVIFSLYQYKILQK